jgi:hypothetical protein
MRSINHFLAAVIALSLLSSVAQAQSCSAMSLGRGASLNGFIPFPADNAWNQDISTASVDPNSANIINLIGATTTLHPDFGSGLYAGQTIGIPYVVVSGSPFVNIKYTESGSESDPEPMPVPKTAPIEGYPNPGNGDRHVLVLDRDNCWLYELYSSYLQANGSWDAGSAAVWDLLNDEQRPYTWTSADAAGLSIFPGLARYYEVASGQIHSACVPLGRYLNQHLCRAYGYAHAPEIFVRYFFLSAASASRARSPAKIRHDHGRQRQQHVHQRRSRQSLEQRRSRYSQTGSSLGLRCDPHQPALHAKQCAHRTVAQNRKLHRKSIDNQRRAACHAELDRHWRILLCRLASSRSDPRKLSRSDARGHDYLHAVWHERIRTQRENSQSHCAVIAQMRNNNVLLEHF